MVTAASILVALTLIHAHTLIILWMIVSQLRRVPNIRLICVDVTAPSLEPSERKILDGATLGCFAAGAGVVIRDVTIFMTNCHISVKAFGIASARKYYFVAASCVDCIELVHAWWKLQWPFSTRKKLHIAEVKHSAAITTTRAGIAGEATMTITILFHVSVCASIVAAASTGGVVST